MAPFNNNFKDSTEHTPHPPPHHPAIDGHCMSLIRDVLSVGLKAEGPLIVRPDKRDLTRYYDRYKPI